MREAKIQRWLSTGVCGAVIVVSLGWAQATQAKTPDGETPHAEHICEAARLTGQAYGLCNAYCEAQDCGVHERVSYERLRRNFERKIGLGVFPCDCANSFVFDLDAGCVCDPDLLATCTRRAGSSIPPPATVFSLRAIPTARNCAWRSEASSTRSANVWFRFVETAMRARRTYARSRRSASPSLIPSRAAAGASLSADSTLAGSVGGCARTLGNRAR